jgi:outer membrane protein OmpA-like peptidoglycan-associated protein
MRRLAMLLLCLLCTACPAPREQVTLLDVTEEGGELTVTTTQGTTTLTTPGTAAVSKDGRVERGALGAAAVQEKYGAVLDTLPTPPATYTFHFATRSVAVDADGQATLAALLAELPRRDVVDIQVIGHTDQQGTEAFNERLALARAEAVQALLLQGGVPAASVRVAGIGARAPLVHAPGQAEARNRRVEVRVR